MFISGCEWCVVCAEEIGVKCYVSRVSMVSFKVKDRVRCQGKGQC